MEAFEETIVAAAVVDAMQLGAIGFDAVKQLVLARIERRPARLDLARYPYLPAAQVKTTRRPTTPLCYRGAQHERRTRPRSCWPITSSS